MLDLSLGWAKASKACVDSVTVYRGEPGVGQGSGDRAQADTLAAVQFEWHNKATNGGDTVKF